MKLANLGFKKLRCVVYVQDGQVLVSHKEDHMQRIIDTYGVDCVEIYNPTDEVRLEILRLLEGGQKDFEKVELGNMALLKSIALLTNIDFGDLTEEEAHEIVNNPGNILVAVNNEVSAIHIELLKGQFTVAQSLASMPDAIKKPMVEELVKNVVDEEELRKQEELAELEKQMKELEEKKKALQGE